MAKGISKANLVVLTGAGISAESGIKTFRDAGGLWEGYALEEVATPQAWHQNPELVQRFYNERRKAVLNAEPNLAHRALVRLEQSYDVTIITQNIDDLHQRAGSSTVVHLHGQICMAQSSDNPELVYPVEGDCIEMGQLCELGSQLRPHVVWFGEAVPEMDRAISIVERADLLVVVGTSLVVYPAAGLVDLVSSHCRVILADIKRPEGLENRAIEFYQGAASKVVPLLVEELISSVAVEQ